MPETKSLDLNQSLSITGGPFEARFASTSAELEQAQRLRYQVLFKDSNGNPDAEKVASEMDSDQWDEHADHIVVCDTRLPGANVVGTVRIVSNKRLPATEHFYSEEAFDLSRVRARYDHIVELTRFCISPDTRNGIVLGLIWKLASNYILRNDVDLMIGCASFPEADPSLHTREFGFLIDNAVAPADLEMPPIVPNHTNLKTLCDAANDDAIGDLRDMPALVRGYLKIGARCSDCAIIDPVFNTTFVCIYVDAANFANTTTLLAPKKAKS